MFRHLSEAKVTVCLTVDGHLVAASPDDTVATALLIAGVTPFRKTPVSGAPRAPYCGMGVCFDCLVTIDGEANRQACLTPVREGMTVTTGVPGPSHKRNTRA
ncbi:MULTISPECIES: (2Fe-2S)-binding protein [Rhizobium/Agrobacterium group]|uniref:(2Fe-2S)-binding protein n=1 Tax=Agrobacterium vitis TaxID=373 RepID=A0ABD6HG85_AGRVI|nr:MULTISPECIES: (2Fe-2S)-binding protein [Rhizobium/Agrobacterium group]ASK49739.1 (2Fe-2S)-binding protein [Agrobacterium vitis]MCF1436664.1 (2Fe-2S)-binding protein [Allorhizobium ampelinum]MCF1450243.1 (2Fe-2S)-binding protein [Allorhizobium ampelinum]MCF1495928.1 (2Fe-2S)-binding protein [Allorhizobium ampelinum]MUO31352.1 (2Fe-2S)-binding protein [Agrobacterium vitis]